ncbi:hypothetical protein [Sulfurisphaera ohwakuensis]|uniref:hypothetical protein n=1 Tax=Sulfurisphaera ohwakuensis TaxID=69656 RepID=UPI0036F3486E
MKDEKRTNNKRNNNSNGNYTNDYRDIDVDPLADYISYILSQTKAPLRVRIFIFLYGIYWRMKRLVGKE